MAETTTGAAPPKKRMLFKRPALQAAAPNEEADMFSHSSEFSDIVALEEKRRAEEKARAAALRARKRRRVSNDNEAPLPPKSASPSISLPAKDSHVMSLSDSDNDDSAHVSKPLYEPFKADLTQDIAVRPSMPTPVLIDDDDDNDNDDNNDNDDEPEEDADPAYAALQARVRARIAAKRNGEASRAPITQLLITSELPDTSALLVKARVDTLIEKPRKAWCAKQGFSTKFSDDVFFTWNRTRVYDSTSVARLGIKVDDNGSVTMEGDSNIYDDVNLPKIHVEAWTDELYRERKKEDAAAAAAAAKRLAAEPPVEVEQRTPTPEPVPTAKKLRLKLKAKGKPECGLTVNLTTTIAHLASAYKSRLKIDKSQPITLMFDGERLSPLDTVENYDLEDMDGVDVLLK